MPESLFALIRSRSPADRSQPVIEVPGGPTCSYADLDAATARYAGFMTGLGLAKGDRVAVQVEKSPEAIFLYLACVRAGLVYLPMNTAYVDNEVDYLLGDAGPSLVVCDPARAARTQALAAAHGIRHVLTLDAEG